MTELLGRLELTDDEFFRRLAADPNAKIAAGRVAETYEGYKDLHKDYIDSIKHYLIAVALLIASHFELIDKFGAAGADIKKDAVPLAALLYVTFTLLLFSNFTVKMRAYSSVYDAELETMDASSRLITMMRYPLAYSAGAFSAPAIMMRTHVISTKDFFVSMPLMLTIAFAYVLLGLFTVFITWSAIVLVFRMPDTYWMLKYTALGAFVASFVFSMATCRPMKKRHVYDDKADFAQ